MASTARSARMRPPPPSPSHSLYGMEKVIPPDVRSPGQISLSPYNAPSPARSPLSFLLTPTRLTTPLSPTSSPPNKPLPVEPRRCSRSSSIYSGDSGYTKIIQSYGERDDSPPTMPTILQPKAYRDTVATRLSERFSEPHWPESAPPVPVTHKQSIPLLKLTPDVSPSLSANDSRHAPSFAEFSHHIREKRNDLVSPMSAEASPRLQRISLSPPSPETLPAFQTIYIDNDEDLQALPLSLPNRVSDTVDAQLIPPPLNLNRMSTSLAAAEVQRARSFRKAQDNDLTAYLDSEIRRQHQHQHKHQHDELIKSPAAKKIYRLSTDSFSDDSFTVYNGAREAVQAMIREKIRKRKSIKRNKKASKEVKRGEKSQQQEMNRVLSFAGRGYLGMKTSTPRVSVTNSQMDIVLGKPQRQFSWVSSHRSSMKQGVENLMRKLSVRDRLLPRAAEEGEAGEDRGRTMERGRSRRRQKQRAISTTPYQRYGADIWLAKNKRKREKVRAERRAAAEALALGEVAAPRHGTQQRQSVGVGHELAVALQNGRSQLLGVFHKGRSASQRRREQIKKTIILVGPTIVGGEHVEPQGGWL